MAPLEARFYIPAKTDALFSLLPSGSRWISFRAVPLIDIMVKKEILKSKLENLVFRENKMGILFWFWFCSGTGEGSLDRLLPPVTTGLSPRKRTTSQCKSEPPLLRTSKRTIYTAGRPPWYNEHGTQSKEAFVIGRT